jgi:HD superfamily phosphohydrolase
VHGSIALSGTALDLIGTGEFQRLWGIRQTGFAHLVFPGANHTRLEHSLGVFWVASAMARALGLNRPATELVTLGGLLHDVGHGPFSHTLEPTMHEVLGIDHERRSRELIEGRRPLSGALEGSPRVCEVLESYGIDPSVIADLIDPPASNTTPTLLRDLLHGAIDADRIDYLQRDAHYTGVGHGAIDAVRIIGTVRRFRGRLAFAGKGRSALEGFLVGRSLMYTSVYYHKTVRAAEVMAQSAVERLPGFPGSARELFDLVDGDLLCELRRMDRRASALAGALLARRLHKRVMGLEFPEGVGTEPWLRLARSPTLRREVEDQVSDHLRVPPGSALLDLAGLEPRPGSVEDWQGVTVLEDGRPTHPFGAPSLWNDLARRSPTVDPVSLYLPPAYRSIPQARVRRALAAVV